MMNDQARGRQTVEQLTNKSGGGVIAGDVVIVDTTNNTAFTTTTSAQITVPVGVALETIASNATGRVLTHGYAPLINVPASVTRGYYLESHTVAKQAVGNATRRAGSFGIFLIGGTTPTAWIWGAPDMGAGGGFTTGDIHEVELYRGTLGAAGNFDVSGISGSYDHLIIRGLLRGDVGAINDNLVMFFNNDTTESNYLRAMAYWGSASGSGITTTMFACPAASSQAGDFGQVEIHIYNYAGSQTKNYMSRANMRWDATNLYLYVNHGNWENTAAITRITIQTDNHPTDKLAIGSFLQIVGVKTEA